MKSSTNSWIHHNSYSVELYNYVRSSTKGYPHSSGQMQSNIAITNMTTVFTVHTYTFLKSFSTAKVSKCLLLYAWEHENKFVKSPSMIVSICPEELWTHSSIWDFFLMELMQYNSHLIVEHRLRLSWTDPHPLLYICVCGRISGAAWTCA